MTTETTAKRIVICQLCRKRLMKMPSGAWYHIRKSSAFCNPGDGTHRKAVPLEITGAK